MKTRVLVILLIFISTATFGQKKLADKFYKNYAYVKATELYEKAYEKGDDSEHVLTRLGDCYYNNSNTEKAAIWYKRALDKYPKINSEYIYKYIQTQRSLGNYEIAEEWVTKFNALQGEDAKKKYSFGDLALYKKLASTDQVYVEISNLDSNSKYSDFGSFEHNGKLYFASSRNAGEAKNYSWNDEPYLDIYEAAVSSNDGKKSLSNVDFIKSEDINTDFHEATVAITKDGSTIYFTRDNVNRRNKLDYDRKGTSHLKIYKATLVNGNWENIKELPFNDDVFSTGHPALSPNEKQLYFVSDRDGGLGQTDIYVVDILENDKYSDPKNLGASVNTPGKEMFPYIAKDNTLYFSSDGYVNLGLLDIFKSDYLKNVDTEPENLGAPFNSGADDFAFFIDSDTKEGYFSSNREGGKGNDDIYSFAAYNCTQTVNGVVLNSETSQPIANATVQKIDATGKIVEEYSTNDKGEYSFEVDCDQAYTILAKKEDHKDDLKELTTTSENKKNHVVNLDLIPLIKDNQIVINPIFFDFDKWNIRTDAEYELENIIDVMREHPNMVIKIESHTDSRGKDKYNMKLSDRRAKSTKEYLLSRGIAPNRIESAIGYGESQLLNKCSNGVKCTEEEHQLNRRSYFYILKY